MKKLLTINTATLARGLRPSKRLPRNRSFLTKCEGAVGRDGILQVIDQLSPINIAAQEVVGTDTNNYTCILSHTSDAANRPVTGGSYATYWTQTGTGGGVWADDTAYSKGIDDGFPYPQLFVFTNMIIVCGETDIFEYVNGALDWKLTVTAGNTWAAADFYDYVYMSNSKVAVVKSASTGVYATTTKLPIASSIINFNGQVLIGAPGVEA